MVICGHCNLLTPAWLLARLHNAHLVLVIHGIEAWEPSRHRIANWLASRVRCADLGQPLFGRALFALVTLSGGAGVHPTQLCRSQAVPSAAKGCGPRRTLRAPVQPGYYDGGHLASLERKKGIDELIELMPRLVELHPTVKYMIVGEGHDRPRLEAKVKSLKISNNVIFTGRVPKSEKVAHYNLADVFVMPSRGEGFGIVLIEAAACGIPVIGSDTDGSREALLHGKLGEVIYPAEFEAVVRCDLRCIERSAPRTAE